MNFSAYQDSDVALYEISIVSSGHIFAPQGRRIHRPNGRNDYLLFYIAKGSEYMLLEDEIQMKEGSFIFFKPNEKQIHIQRENIVSEFYYIHFNAPDNFDLFGFNSSTIYTVDISTQINHLFEEIIEELQNKKPLYEKMCVSIFLNLLTLLSRRYLNITTPLAHYTDKISFVIQNMNKEYYENYSLDDYAKMCIMGKFHFLRIFKSITGITPIEYRNNIRIEHAKEMLEETNDSIDEIAHKVGYTSNVYFCEAFKAKLGMSPSKYRSKFR